MLAVEGTFPPVPCVGAVVRSFAYKRQLLSNKYFSKGGNRKIQFPRGLFCSNRTLSNRIVSNRTVGNQTVPAICEDIMSNQIVYC